jgi:hypothetical protein
MHFQNQRWKLTFFQSKTLIDSVSNCNTVSLLFIQRVEGHQTAEGEQFLSSSVFCRQTVDQEVDHGHQDVP